MDEVLVTGSTDRWEARVGADPVGALRAWTRPDRRRFLVFRDCRADAYGPLVKAATTTVGRDLFTLVDDGDQPSLDRLGALGFLVHQREDRYRIASDPARYGLTDVPPPPGIDLISAADADVGRLRTLDEALREDIPGSEGWRWEPADFEEETFGGDFDPATYVVAVERATGAYIGLVRVWMNRTGPRLGCLAVLPAFRRTRVTGSLVAAVAMVLHERGHAAVTTEMADDNRAAQALIARRGALRTGGSVQLVLPRG